jgi:nicotinamidase-related amidase
VQLHAQPQDLLLDLSRTALVVIDMQNDFCAPDGWMASLGADVAPARALTGAINEVTAVLRRCDVPVIWLNWGVRPDRLNLYPSVQHPFNPTGRGPGLAGQVNGPGAAHALLQKDSWGASIFAELTQDARDIHVDKHRISGFWDTPLESILRNLDISTLIFAGINADHCVLGTLMDANFHGFDTILLQDCTATTSPDFCQCRGSGEAAGSPGPARSVHLPEPKHSGSAPGASAPLPRSPQRPLQPSRHRPRRKDAMRPQQTGRPRPADTCS